MIFFRPSPFLARISYWPRASASSLAKIAAACGLGLDASPSRPRPRRRRSILAFSALAGASSDGPLLGLDLLGLGQGGLRHRPVLRLQHRRLGLALLRLAELVRLGLLHLKRRPGPRRSSAWAVASPAIALALASARRTRFSRSASATCASRSNAACLLADLLVAVELGDADRLLPLRLLDQRFLFEQRPSARRPAAPCRAGRPGPPARGSPRGCRSRAAWWRWPPGWPARARPRRRRSGPSSPARRRRSSPAGSPAPPPCGRSPRCSPPRR